MLSFSFEIGDKNKNKKIDVSARLSVFGFVIFQKTQDLTLEKAFDLFKDSTKVFTDLTKKLGK